jgi:hypothetical protein
MTSSHQPTAVHPVEWSKKAIASVILSSIGFITLWLIVGLFLSALGAILGHLAKQDIRDHAYRGRRLATFGLGMSYGSMLLVPLMALLVAVSFPAMSKWKSGQDADLRALGRANSARLFIACEEYARANRDHYPVEWDDLSGRYLPSGELAKLLKSPYPKGKREAFELVRHDRPVLDAISDSVIVIQEIAPAEISEITVVYANGTVSNLHNPDYEKP